MVAKKIKIKWLNILLSHVLGQRVLCQEEKVQTKSAWEGNNHLKKKKILPVVQSSVSTRKWSGLNRTWISLGLFLKTCCGFFHSHQDKFFRSQGRYASINHGGHRTSWVQEDCGLINGNLLFFPSSSSLKENGRAHVLRKDKVSRALLQLRQECEYWSNFPG